MSDIKPIPNGWRHIYGLERACLFISGKPICGRTASTHTVPADMTLATVPSCTDCDRLNDGLWYLGIIAPKAGAL